MISKNKRDLLLIPVKFLAILFGASMVGYLLLAASFLIPVNPSTVDSYTQYTDYMGWSPLVYNRYSEYLSYFDSWEPGALDDATDKIIISYSLSDEEGTAFEKAASMHGYGRYWHGYMIVLRPLFYLFDLWNVYALNGLLQVVLVGVLCLLTYKETQRIRYSLAVLTAYLLLMPMALMASFQYSSVFYVSFISGISALLLKDRLSKNNGFLYFFLITGIATSYFDLLTYPLLAWGLPLCLLLVAWQDEADCKKGFRIVVESAVSWIVGYVGMFLAKWCIVQLVCGHFDKSNAGEALFMMKSVPGWLTLSKSVYHRYEILYTNWRHYLYAGYVLILLIWIAWAAYKYLKGKLVFTSGSLPLLIVTLSSPAWYLVFTTHTAIHHFFTYRIYSVSILAFLLILCSSVREGDARLEQKNRIHTLAVFALMLLVGLFATRLSKENVEAIFGERATEIELTENDVLTVDMKPTFSNIKAVMPCVKFVDGTEGSLEIALKDKETVLYTESVPLDSFIKLPFIYYDVDWKLDSDKTYTMEYRVAGNDSGIRFSVTSEGEKPLIEFGDVYLNGEYMGVREPAGGFVYRTYIRSRRDTAYMALLVAVYLFAAYGIIKDTVKTRKKV